MTQIQPLAPRSALWSAFRSGGLVGVSLRPSRRSPSGVVLVAGFASVAAGRRFAARRPGSALRLVGGFWCVSVPVASAVPFRRAAWSVVGGVRRVAVVAGGVSVASL